MLSYKLLHCALVAFSLSAAAAAAPTQDNNVHLHRDLDYSGNSQDPKVGACTNLDASTNGLFHHLGSAQVPDGYTCSLFFDPNCENTPICRLTGSHPDLLTLEGNPCPNAMAFGVGYGVESVLCTGGV